MTHSAMEGVGVGSERGRTALRPRRTGGADAGRCRVPIPMRADDNKPLSEEVD